MCHAVLRGMEMNQIADIVDVSEATFESQVVGRSRQTPVVVDFWAPWCGPCRTLGPMLERLASESQGGFRLAKVNVDDNQNLAVRFNVSGIPAVKGFRDGKVVAEFVGAQPETMVRKFLEKVMPAGAATGSGAAEAERLLAAHRWVDAEAAYLRTAPGTGQESMATIGLAKALLGQGKGAQAVRLLAGPLEGTDPALVERLRALASLLVEAESDPEAASGDGMAEGYRAAGRLVARGDLTGAMDGLLALLRRDKRYRQGAARLSMLAILDLLGEEDPLTRTYRNMLASVLF